MTPPKAISAPDPQYMEFARLYKLQGTTVLELTVSTVGNPVDILITRPLGFGLDDQAVAAVRSWKFPPATLKGQPVPVRVNVEVNFRGAVRLVSEIRSLSGNPPARGQPFRRG